MYKSEEEAAQKLAENNTVRIEKRRSFVYLRVKNG
jgi:hypothetical protein